MQFEESGIVSFQKDAYEELCLQRSGRVDEKAYWEQVLKKLKPKERDLYRKYYIDKKTMNAIARGFPVPVKAKGA